MSFQDLHIQTVRGDRMNVHAGGSLDPVMNLLGPHLQTVCGDRNEFRVTSDPCGRSIRTAGIYTEDAERINHSSPMSSCTEGSEDRSVGDERSPVLHFGQFWR